ncbi:unnamed protein product, partial [Ascophyllum nodosum]
SLSGHANAYRWRSLPTVRRHRASTLQGKNKVHMVTRGRKYTIPGFPLQR